MNRTQDAVAPARRQRWGALPTAPSGRCSPRTGAPKSPHQLPHGKAYGGLVRRCVTFMSKTGGLALRRAPSRRPHWSCRSTMPRRPGRLQWRDPTTAGRGPSHGNRHGLRVPSAAAPATAIHSSASRSRCRRAGRHPGIIECGEHQRRGVDAGQEVHCAAGFIVVGRTMEAVARPVEAIVVVQQVRRAFDTLSLALRQLGARGHGFAFDQSEDCPMIEVVAEAYQAATRAQEIDRRRYGDGPRRSAHACPARPGISAGSRRPASTRPPPRRAA